jgi:phosphotransferase family enzyme
VTRFDFEQRLPGGNVAGAVRVGDTVRRATGPWTPAVHALLDYLADRIPHVPKVLGFDQAGREILSYLPGQVVDGHTQPLTEGQLDSLVRWTRTLHDAVRGFAHPGPWRYFALPAPNPLIGHNDIAPYNACFDADELVGVFDWDMSGPTSPLHELAFIAWNCVPLWLDIGPDLAAHRLTLISTSYGGSIGAKQLLAAVPPRIEALLAGIPVAAAAGDAGMVNLMAAGEPARSARSLAELVSRLPGIARALPAF